MSQMPIEIMEKPKLDGELIHSYLEYLGIRIRFLLDRFQRYPDFPGVHTGYDSITGEEFSDKYIFPYSWINGRGVSVFTRLADFFPQYSEKLNAYALHVISSMENHWERNNHHFPFMANLDGTERDVGVKPPPGFKSYSDLYACAGFIEYGARRNDKKRLDMAKEIFTTTIEALDERKFVTEPDPTPEDRILENPWSVAVDLANEFVKHLNDQKYLDISARLITYLLDHYYIESLGAYIEYITPDGKPFLDEEERYIVDPGHAIEFCSFCLEFARLAAKYQRFGSLCDRIHKIIPALLHWNIEHGWNKNYPGIYKTIDARSSAPLNETMPWWILPETLLGTILGYESCNDSVFLQHFMNAHNTYFTIYMNTKTKYGPYQNIDGKTGKPVGVVPACKFQDPEFHSGKNILTVTEVYKRITDVDE